MATAALMAASVALPRQARAEAAPSPPPKASAGKIGVAALGAPGLSTELRLKMEEAAAAGLRASGAEVISSAELSRARSAAALGACTDTSCEQKLAQLTDTRYWLRGNVALDTSTYRIHLELTDARSGSVVSARDDSCDICTEADATEAVNMAASTLKAAAKANLTAAAAPVRAPAVAPPVTAPPAPAAGTSENGTPAPPLEGGTTDSGVDQAGGGRPTWLRVLPWVAFAGAAGALAGGAYLWSVDGDTETCPPDRDGNVCTGTKDTRPWKYVYTGAGVVLAAAGVVLLLLPDPTPAAPTTAGHAGARLRTAAAPARHPVTVGIWGQGLMLSGQF